MSSTARKEAKEPAQNIEDDLTLEGDGTSDTTPPETDDATSPALGGVEKTIAGSSSGGAIGALLESVTLQWAIVLVLLVDIAGAVLYLLIDAGVDPFGIGLSKRGLRALLVFLALALDGCLCTFTAELISLAVMFNYRIIFHMGYVMDLAIVGTCAWSRFMGSGRVSLHLLSALRLWRLARIFWSELAASEAELASVRDALEASKAEVTTLRLAGDRAKEEAKKDQKARHDVQEMMRRYKGRVDHLSEALIIASETVARAQAGGMNVGMTDMAMGMGMDAEIKLGINDGGNGRSSGGSSSNNPQIVVSGTGRFQVKSRAKSSSSSSARRSRQRQRQNPDPQPSQSQLWSIGDDDDDGDDAAGWGGES